MTGNPFAVLGLPARPDLTDEQVRAAWRAIATTAHPDRPGGGDPARYAAASAAYTALRTPWARSEAYADLAAGTIPAPDTRQDRRPAVPVLAAAVLLPARIRHGRPARLALRTLAAALAAFLAARSGAGTPAIAAVLAGVVLWLALTARGDLAPPPGR